ncbi:hypothetical protein ACJMK2_015214, partial [Sinanodonta woodiana]
LDPINLVEEAIPTIGRLPDGVSIVYDAVSHVHALQFLPDIAEIGFSTERLLRHCTYFPEEFSIFFILKHGREYAKQECIFSIENENNLILSISLSKRKVIFQYNSIKVTFRNVALKDNNWHTFGFSVSGSFVAMTTDCLNMRLKRLKRTFPSFIEVKNSTVTIAKCPGYGSVLRGNLKDIILVPGADVAKRTCPPRVPRNFLIDNRLPLLPDISAYQSAGPRWEDCTWMDVGNLAFDVYSHSLKVCVNGIWKQVSLKLAESQKKHLDYLEVYQDLETPAAAIDVELFTIPGVGIFAVFANSESNKRKRRKVSGMYKWVDKKFQLYQKLPTVAAQSWCHFTIGSHFYLAVANYGDDTDAVINSTIFRWHSHRKIFRVYQSITTYTARDVEYFQIDGEHFLAVANHAKGQSQYVDSAILKWNYKSRLFQEIQTIPTVGAYDWTYFVVDGFHFLALAQTFDGQTTLLDSVIYVYRGKHFVQFQAIETNGATDWEFFTIGEEAFLVVSNAYNYGPQNFQGLDTYRTNSSLYTLNRQKRAFEKYQTFHTFSAIDWEHFMIGDDHFLVVSNAQNGGTELERQSTMYRLQGVDRFVPVHNMALRPSSDWEMFQDDDEYYFVYSNAKSTMSQVLKAKFKYV